MDGPLLSVDCTVFDDEDRLLLIRRRNPPFHSRSRIRKRMEDGLSRLRSPENRGRRGTLAL